MMDFGWGRWPDFAFKILALLITCGLVYLFRDKCLDFDSALLKTQKWLMVGFVVLLIGITVYYS